MSAMVKTQGLVLRVDPFSKTSHWVVWLTPDYGLVTTLAKGVQKPRSALLGQFDVFYTCEIIYHGRSAFSLAGLRECAPTATRERFRSDWRAAGCASYLCDLVARTSLPGGEPSRIWALLTKALDCLQEQGANALLPRWFEIKLLQAIGLAPQLRRCSGCKSQLDVTARGMRFSPARGGMLCARCAERAGARRFVIPPDVLAMMRAWQASESPTIARRTSWSARQCASAERLLGEFLFYHLDTPGTARRLATEILRPARCA